jgi:hypothetical protein
MLDEECICLFIPRQAMYHTRQWNERSMFAQGAKADDDLVAHLCKWRTGCPASQNERCCRASFDSVFAGPVVENTNRLGNNV